MSAQIQDILTALKDTLAPLGVDLYDYVPDSPNVPCVAVYCERWPYAAPDPNDQPVFKLWCVAGTVDMQGAQEQLMGWLSDDGETSIVALLDADSTLDDLVGSVLPVEATWSIQSTAEGRPRYVQAEITLHVLR